MVLRVSGKNFSIGDAMRVHVEERVAAAVAKYFDGSVSGHVVVDHEGSGYRSDCMLHLASGVTMQAEGRAQDPYASFDQAALRLEKRLRRYKRRLKDHHAADSGNGETFVDYVLEAPVDDDDTAYHPLVIAERTSQLKTVAIETAVAELDVTGAPLVIFRHAGSARVNIVYRRSDGHVGWIDPTAAQPPADGGGPGRR